jgi:hypothetical protein
MIIVCGIDDEAVIGVNISSDVRGELEAGEADLDVSMGPSHDEWLCLPKRLPRC